MPAFYTFQASVLESFCLGFLVGWHTSQLDMAHLFEREFNL